jgi:hypothetical protein
MALPATTVLLVSLWLAAGGLAIGCDRNTEPFVEGEKPRAPDLARIFPASDPNARPAGPRSPAGPGDRTLPAAGAARRADVGAETIKGTVAVLPELVDAIPESGSLFVIARLVGVAAGPPLAVLRIPAPRFPVSFEIGPGNVMIPSMRFQGEIQITARLDSDGNAITKLPGDLSGAARSSHVPGTSGVDILLDTRI